MRFLIHLRKHLCSIFPKFRRPLRRKYLRLPDPPTDPETRVSSWCKWVKQKATRLMIRSARDPAVPKGFLAVHVGRERNRVVVPVVYFNHPLFSQLLKEAEDVFGYENTGCIKLPCRISEFERVQSTIQEGCFSGGHWKELR